jgi:hypothetical protein
MKNFIVNLFFKYYFKDEFKKPLNEKQQDYLLTKISNDSNLQQLPLFLDQCANNARNKYLYTNDPIFKGSIMAYVFLKEQLAKRKAPSVKKKLTESEKVAIMKGRGY